MSRALVLVDVDDATGEVTFKRWRTRGGGVVDVVAEVTTDLDGAVDGGGVRVQVPSTYAVGAVLRWLGRLLVDAE